MSASACSTCVRFVACPVHRQTSHLNILPGDLASIHALGSKMDANIPTPLASASRQKSSLKTSIISERARSKRAAAAASAAQAPPSKRQQKLLRRTQKARSRGKPANDIWFFFRATNDAKMPAGANQVEICAEDSAYQVSQPFSQYKRPTDGKFLRCTLCLRSCGEWTTYANRSDGLTGLLRSHLEREHGLTYRSKCEAEGVTPRSVNSNIDSDNEEFTPQGLRDRIARWAAIDDQAMRAVERREFIQLLIYCSRARTALRRRDIPRRNRITKAMHELYLAEKSRIIEEMRNTQGLISITSDLWSDANLRSFMAVTAHYIDAEGLLAEHLIAFRRIDGSHAGVNLGQYLFSVLEETGITNKIGFITLDNAANNDTLMRELEVEFREHNIETFGSESNRIRCFPHVINLAVGDILEFLPEAAQCYREAAAARGLQIDAETEEYLLALESKPVNACRQLVNWMRKSDGRREGLQSAIDDGNLYGLFTNTLGQTIEVPTLQLLTDSETRWSSTHNMICRLVQLYPAIMHYSAQNPALKVPLMSRMQIEVLQDICSILSVINNAQELLSAERTPTLSLALPVYETLIQTLADLRSIFPELSYAITSGIEKLEQYVSKTRCIPVYALAMVINPCFKLEWIDSHWESAAREQAYAAVRDQMLRHRTAHPDSAALNVHAPAEKAAQALGSGFARLLTGGLTIARASLAHPSNNPYIPSEPTPLFNPFSPTSNLRIPQDPAIAVEAELARWVGEGTLDAQKMGGVELVQYWKMRRFEFPLLYRIAMDVLPAQASLVSCERAFSSSKLTCTRERNLISPENLERLQFLKHALHRQPISMYSGLDTLPLDFMAHITHPVIDTGANTDSYMSDAESDFGSGNESDIEHESD